MPSISRQPILNNNNYGDFGSILNESGTSNLKNYDSFDERQEYTDKFR